MITVSQTFERSPRVSEWRRFLLKSARVKTWRDSVFKSQGNNWHISQKALSDIALTRTTINIFPNLRTIFAATHDFHTITMGEAVVDLTLMVTSMGQEPHLRIPVTLENVRDRLTNLQNLSLFYDPDTLELPNYDDQITALLRHMPRLKTLTLPLFCLNGPMVQALSCHKNMQEIHVDSEDPFATYPCNAETRTVSTMNHPLGTDAFPALRHIAFSTATVTDARSFIIQTAFPSKHITNLWIHTPSIPPSSAVRDLISGLAGVCLSLTTLELIFQAPTYSEDSNMSSVDPIQARHLLHLPTLARLSTFRIRHPYPIAIGDADFAELLAKWPHLRSLSLNPHPVVTMPTMLTLGAFLPLAMHCRGLTELGLYIDATLAVPPLPRDVVALKYELPISTLYLGRSPLSSEDDASTTTYPEVARYLGSFIKGGSPVKWMWPDGDIFPPQLQDEEDWLHDLAVYNELADYEEGWKTIEVMTGLVLDGKRSVRGWHQLIGTGK